MNDIELETIKLRLDGIRQSIIRSRTTFLISTIAAVAILVTAYNAYLSWDSNFVAQAYWSQDPLFTEKEKTERANELKIRDSLNNTVPGNEVVKPQSGLTPVTDYAQQQLVGEWVKNQIITVGLLGIRVGVSDLPVLGSLSLIIISVWFFYSVRRENRAIATLLRDTHRLKDWHVRYMVYQGIVHHLVLIDFGRGTKPIYDFRKEENQDVSNFPFVRGLLKILFYLPPLSILFVIGMDILTLVYLSAPFRPSHRPLGQLLTAGDWVKVFSMESFAVLLLLLTAYLCRKTVEFNKATEHLLKEYRSELRKTIGERRLSD